MDATLQSTDKEASLKQQVLELHKKKVSRGGGACGWLGERVGRVGPQGLIASISWGKTPALETGTCPLEIHVHV